MVAVGGIAAFIAIERRTRVPMVDFRFFGSRTFMGSSIVAFIVSFSMLGMFSSSRRSRAA